MHTLSDKIPSDKFFVGQNFRHQAEISTIMSDEFLSAANVILYSYDLFI